MHRTFRLGSSMGGLEVTFDAAIGDLLCSDQVLNVVPIMRCVARFPF